MSMTKMIPYLEHNTITRDYYNRSDLEITEVPKDKHTIPSTRYELRFDWRGVSVGLHLFDDRLQLIESKGGGCSYSFTWCAYPDHLCPVGDFSFSRFDDVRFRCWFQDTVIRMINEMLKGCEA